MNALTLLQLQFGFLAVTGLLGAAATDNGPNECDKNRKAVYGGTSVLLRQLISYALPNPHGLIEPRPIPEKPLIFKITVSAQGIPYSVVPEEHGSSPVVQYIERYLRDWRFKAPLINGEPMCIKSRLYVYIRTANGHLVLEVPYLEEGEHPYLIYHTKSAEKVK